MGGAKLAFDYGYKLTGGAMPAWLDLAAQHPARHLHVEHGRHAVRPQTGSVFETLAGVKWKFATPIPLVPFVGAARASRSASPTARDAGWASWPAPSAARTTSSSTGSASGLQVGYSLGHLGYDDTFTGSHTYAVFDFGGGVEFQF